MFIYYLIILNEYFTAAHLCRVAPVGKEMRGCVDRRIHTFQLQKATAAKRGEHTWQRFSSGGFCPCEARFYAELLRGVEILRKEEMMDEKKEKNDDSGIWDYESSR